MSLNFKNKLFISFVLLSLIYSINAMAKPAIQLINSKYNDKNVSIPKITQIIERYVDINQYRAIKFQIIYTEKHVIDHLIVYLFSKKYHKVEFVRINLNTNFAVSSVQRNYHLSSIDYAQQPGITAREATCPDDSIEFIAFAPNDDDFEQDITKDVARAAEKHTLKTVSLLLEDATRDNYLNYMSCPKLKGNFYDGDADPEAITTVNGLISYEDINDNLSHKFRYKVTNIWLACEAFNDPIKTSAMTIAQSQKYAAGYNDLLVGPSDKAAACAMKAAMDGQPMTAAFEVCYQKYDDPEDQWGFDGQGADIFGR